MEVSASFLEQKPIPKPRMEFIPGECQTQLKQSNFSEKKNRANVHWEYFEKSSVPKS